MSFAKLKDAAYAGDIEGIKKCLDARVNINAVNSDVRIFPSLAYSISLAHTCTSTCTRACVGGCKCVCACVCVRVCV